MAKNNRKRLNMVLGILVLLLGGIAISRHSPARHGPSSSRCAMPADVSLSGDGFSAEAEGKPRPPSRRRPSSPKIGPQDITIDFFTHNPSFSLLTSDGRVTGDAMDFAGIDPGRKNEVQRVFDDVARKAEDSIRKRIVYDAQASNEGLGIHVYRIAGNLAEGESILRQAAIDLESIVGRSEAMILMSGLSPYSHYGAYGMCDTVLEFSQTTGSDQPPGWWVDVSVKNPITGKMLVSSMEGSSLKDYFGGLFDFTFQ